MCVRVSRRVNMRMRVRVHSCVCLRKHARRPHNEERAFPDEVGKFGGACRIGSARSEPRSGRKLQSRRGFVSATTKSGRVCGVHRSVLDVPRLVVGGVPQVLNYTTKHVASLGANDRIAARVHPHLSAIAGQANDLHLRGAMYARICRSILSVLRRMLQASSCRRTTTSTSPISRREHTWPQWELNSEHGGGIPDV